jgi:hypothetical protein
VCFGEGFGEDKQNQNPKFFISVKAVLISQYLATELSKEFILLPLHPPLTTPAVFPCQW